MARLHFQPAEAGKAGAWATGKNDVNQWLQIDLIRQNTHVTRVATQGRNEGVSQWVTKYQLQFTNDAAVFQYYKEQGKTDYKVSYKSVS